MRRTIQIGPDAGRQPLGYILAGECSARIP